MLGRIAVIVFIAGFMLSNSAEIDRTAGFSDKSSISPSDKILKQDIHVYKDKIVIDIDNAIWAGIKDTGSMEPVLNKNSNSIELKPYSEADIALGDIISYSTEDNILIHRVIEIGQDINGWFAITKGDNNEKADPKVRFKQIKGVVIGILY